jgi:hypothetical protein
MIRYQMKLRRVERQIVMSRDKSLIESAFAFCSVSSYRTEGCIIQRLKTTLPPFQAQVAAKKPQLVKFDACFHRAAGKEIPPRSMSAYLSCFSQPNLL